jgi:hypothetical protein
MLCNRSHSFVLSGLLIDKKDEEEVTGETTYTIMLNQRDVLFIVFMTVTALVLRQFLIISSVQPDLFGSMLESFPLNQPHQIPQRSWAYAFLMAGVDVNHRGYRGILYNVLVAAEVMKDSQADIIVMVQMSSPSQPLRLSPKEEGWLQAMNVKIKYLDYPSHGVQNYYTVQLEKFHILELTEYSRVLYLDGDILPACPLDYIFEMSEPLQEQLSVGSAEGTTAVKPPLLKENLVIAWSVEPSNGGFFMLAPKEGDFELVQGEIRRREDEVLASGKVFDIRRGWGHVIEPPDHWHSSHGSEGDNATNWRWHADFADQGKTEMPV